MDRFIWHQGYAPGETVVIQQTGVKIYDGDSSKPSYENGTAILTQYQVLWQGKQHKDECLALPMASVAFTESEAASFTKSAKIICHLKAVEGYKPPGPVQRSSYTFIRLSFKEGGQEEFHKRLCEQLQLFQTNVLQAGDRKSPEKKAPVKNDVRPKASGIHGIISSRDKKHAETDESINTAFRDLDKLKSQAQNMVKLSNQIKEKLERNQGGLNDDEIIEFKKHLLSMGIADPVTRSECSSSSEYIIRLASEICDHLVKPIEECGGIMTLTDAYLRLNRARALQELVSPDDLYTACKQLGSNSKLRLRQFDSGVKVLQLSSLNEEVIVKQTSSLVEEMGSLTADELSKQVGISVILSKERLLRCEEKAKVCRDESTEGLRFYPNTFLVES